MRHKAKTFKSKPTKIYAGVQFFYYCVKDKRSMLINMKYVCIPQQKYSICAHKICKPRFDCHSFTCY